MQNATSVFPDGLPRLAMPRPIAPAFVASLAVHAMLALALVSWVTVGDRAQFPGRDALAVLLVGTSAPPSAEAPSGDLSIAVPTRETPLLAEPAAQVEARNALPPSAASDARAQPAPRAAAASAARVVSLGSVDVRLLDEDMVTSLHPVHANRVGSEFPAEIAQGVRLAANPDVKYPEDALAARRQGSVLAFVIVDANGAVEEVSIVEGAPEFAQTVQDALLTTRFLPASDGDRPIRFYTMLRFDFLPNSPGAEPATDARAKPGVN
jgi:TonB family protein